MAITSTYSSAIIKTKAKHVEVIAIPGSGKTTTAIQYVQHLCSTEPHSQILVLSFSKASVRELYQRMKAVINSPAMPRATVENANLESITIKTVHAYSRSLIKRQNVLTDKKAESLIGVAIRRVLKKCKGKTLWPDVSPEIRRQRVAQIDQLLKPQQIKLVLIFLAIARASKKKLSEAAVGQFDQFKQYIKVLHAIRNGYAEAKKKKRVIDYTDMLTLAVKAIRGGAHVPYSHILVDEYQDCSAAQAHFLAQLATDRNIMVFGDQHQGIFGFAGSSYTPLSSVLDYVKTFDLPISHRLTAQTAALASAIAQHDTEQTIQTMRTGKSPLLFEDDSLHAQAKRIAQDIQQLISDGVQPTKIVVLARIKALLHPIEQTLLAHNVLTKRMGTTRQRKHAYRVLKLISLVKRREKDGKEFSPEMLRKSLPGITADDDTWKKQTLKLSKVIRVPSLEGRYRLCANIYLRLLGGIRANKELYADVNRWEPLCRSHDNALTMREAVRAMDANAVNTGTIHASKGGEWEYVLIVGATDGLLPLYLAKDECSLSEERNLLYVAVTRARGQVRLYHAPSDHARSRQQFGSVSRFLKESAVSKTLRFN